MGNTIEQLEFKILLNKTQKKTKNWETTVMSEDILDKLPLFLIGRVGQAWLKSAEGQDYLKWQRG